MKKNLLFPFIFVSSAAVAQVTVTPIGLSGSPFSAAFGSRTNLWYDSVLNTVAFFHRSDTPTISDIRYDYSTNGGVTWLVNKGPVYATDGTHNGRYPQGIIYNPSGNTVPDSAFVTAYGPNTNGTSWITNYEGTSQIGSLTHNQKLYLTTIGGGQLNDVIPEGMQVVKNTGTVWVVANGTHANGYTNDSIFLGKGIYSNGDFSYDFSKTFYAPVTDSSGLSAISTAWSDDGMTGYVVRLVNDHHLPLSSVDSVYVPQVWKTINGGNTWFLKTTDSTNMDINQFHTLLLNSGIVLTTGFDVDCAVDKNNNLHIAVAIGGSGGGYSINSTYKAWGIFDIYTVDGGDTWCGQLLATPETFRIGYGGGAICHPFIDENNRQQVSRSWDGSKIFISWFDTDTTNSGPDLHSIGYDVDNGLWSTATNFTHGTGLKCDGGSYFGCVSYYAITNGSDYCIPVTFSDTGDGNCAFSFYYIGGACINSFNQPSLCAPLSVTENNLSTTLIKIYPNPLTSSSILELNTSVKNAEVIIYDMLGKELLRKQLTDNKTEIEKGALESGVYLVKVAKGEKLCIQKLIVQ